MPRQMPRYGMPPSRATRQAGRVAAEPVETLSLKRLRDEVDVGDVLVGDDGLGLDIGEERDLVPDVRRERLSRAADDDVGMDTDPPQLIDRMLRRLRLQLSGGVDERHERDVQVEHVLGPGLTAELANRFEEGQRLDVAYRAADLGNDDVTVARLHRAPDALLDLVRDVWDDLDRRAEVLA